MNFQGSESSPLPYSLKLVTDGALCVLGRGWGQGELVDNVSVAELITNLESIWTMPKLFRQHQEDGIGS